MKKLTYIIAIILCSMNFTFGQGTGFVRYGGPGITSYFVQMIAVENGNFLCLGYNNSNNNREIVKLDANLYPVWSYSYSNSIIIGFAGERTCAMLNDGNYVVMGATPTNGGAVVVIKFSPAGTILFQKEYSYTGAFLTVFTIAKAAGNDNGFVIGGGACVKNNFLIKCDATGVVQWAKEYNDFTTTGVKSLFSILPGSVSYTVASSLAGVNGSDVTIMCTDASGSLQWFKQLKMDNQTEMPTKMMKLSNNNLAVLCSGSGIGSPDIVYFMDSTCTTVSYKNYVSPTTDTYIDDIVDDGVSGIIGVGRFYGGVLNERTLFLKLTYTGAITWQKTSRGTSATNISYFKAVVKTPGNKFAMTGGGLHLGQIVGIIDGSGAGMCLDSALNLASTSPLSFTNVSKTITPTNFTLVVSTVNFTSVTSPVVRTQLCGTVSVPEEIDNNSSFTIYPNPSNGKFSIIFSDIIKNGSIEIINVLGKKISEDNILESSSKEILLGNISRGVYFVNVFDGKKSYCKKLIVE